ncbi:MAG: response regulator transcription factor [Gemmatimonadales bacterium]|nr:response regulator transcription factor [Gemmatimonadales bacterium]
MRRERGGGVTNGLIRVLIADDHALVREGIRQVLADVEGFDIVAEAGRGDQALALAREHTPDVAVLDITMEGGSGLEVAALLRQELPATRVLILSMHDHAQYLLQAVMSGAHGYVLKDGQPGELREAVRAVSEGRTFYSPPVADKLTAALRGELEEQQRRNSLDLLTARERDVLKRVADGSTSKEIAAELGISPRTVETHRESLMRKLGIRNVAGLTRFALESGLTDA